MNELYTEIKDFL